jgi:hypothetical protein
VTNISCVRSPEINVFVPIHIFGHFRVSWLSYDLFYVEGKWGQGEGEMDLHTSSNAVNGHQPFSSLRQNCQRTLSLRLCVWYFLDVCGLFSVHSLL